MSLNFGMVGDKILVKKNTLRCNSRQPDENDAQFFNYPQNKFLEVC